MVKLTKNEVMIFCKENYKKGYKQGQQDFADEVLKVVDEAIRDFWGFMEAELDAVRIGEIELGDKTNMLQPDNIKRHFEIFDEELKKKIKQLGGK
jgi:hypothetical protein